VSPAPASGHLKTYILTAFVIASNVVGNLWLTMGVRNSFPLLVAGVLLLILWMLSHMVLLSKADLSYVLPVTSVGYVLSALSGWLFLSEHITTPRWAGIALIMCGVGMVGRTAPRTSGLPASVASKQPTPHSGTNAAATEAPQ
jgi:uncharacterized membrane protein